jgi:hypothetical protein
MLHVKHVQVFLYVFICMEYSFNETPKTSYTTHNCGPKACAAGKRKGSGTREERWIRAMWRSLQTILKQSHCLEIGCLRCFGGTL